MQLSRLYRFVYLAVLSVIASVAFGASVSITVDANVNTKNGVALREKATPLPATLKISPDFDSSGEVALSIQQHGKATGKVAITLTPEGAPIHLPAKFSPLDLPK